MLQYVILGVLLAHTVADNQCLVSYDRERSAASLVLDWIPRTSELQGRPGKRGVSGPAGREGPPGPPGSKGQKGEMPKEVIAEYDAKIQQLEDTIEKLGEGWVTAGNQYSYLVSRHTMTWQEAKALCKSKGAKLATLGIRNGRVRKFIANSILPGRAWIGLSDGEREGHWVWDDDVLSNSGNTAWRDGQPNNYNGDQDCAALAIDSSGIDDKACDTMPNHALCERPPYVLV